MAVASNGDSITTANGGASWSSPVVAAPYGLTGVSCPTASTCYATSSQAPGHVYVTQNSGTSWTLSFDLATDAHAGSSDAFNAIDCPTAIDCYAVGPAGLIAITSDGGVNWHTSFAPMAVNLTDVSCSSSFGCVAASAGSMVFRTTNFGADWSVESGDPGYGLRGVSCPKNVAFGFCAVVGTAGGIATYAGGPDWPKLLPTGSSTNLKAIACPDAGVCYAVGYPGSDILQTQDYGLSWDEKSTFSTDQLNAISCPTINTCYAAGWPGTVYLTTTGGGGWARGPSPLFGSDTTFTGIGCYSVYGCVTVGTSVMSMSDGSTWHVENPGTSQTLNAVKCPSSNLCVAVGAGGTIVTRNSGVWHTRPSGTGTSLRAIDCPTASVCYATGSSGLIIKSGNGGQTWSPLSSGITSSLNGVDCLRDAICLAVGARGSALITVNGGATWTDEQVTYFDDLYGAAFWDPQNVWAVGSGGIILSNQGILDICDSASIDPIPPQQIGSSITLGASANGCSAPEYKFFLQQPGGSWVAVTGWTTNDSYVWPTTHLTRTGV